MYAKPLALIDTAVPSPPPPLKWAGGKRWLVPKLGEIWVRGHVHRRLVEPFVGGLAVALGLQPRKALLNDRNPHLISFYKWLQYGLDPESTGVRFANEGPLYYANRRRFNELIEKGKADTAEAAALFYYLNRTGFNGLCRFNANGFFNVPFGAYKTIPYREHAEDFSDYCDALNGYDLRCGDFEELVLRKSDFVYADPPYDVEFTSYSAGGFNWDDQQRLAKWLSRHPGPVVASNQATKRILHLYRSLGFTVTTLAAPRRISCDGNRDDAREMLATLNL
jgi:DNA adenine methylase